MLIVVSGLPGAGKSTIAVAIGTSLRTPVFSVDPIEAAMWRSGVPASFETGVAAYSRGMKLCRQAGGITTTVIDDRMQRAPVFSFNSAREARAFSQWLDEHFEQIAAAAQETTTSGKLLDIQKFPVSKLLYTRFNYSTGDAAGQNMTSKATFAACASIKQNYPHELHFFSGRPVRHRQEDLDRQHIGYPRQTSGRRDHPSGRARRKADARQHRQTPQRPYAWAARLDHVGYEQQRKPLCERHNRDVHGHRSGRSERRGVVSALRIL